MVAGSVVGGAGVRIRSSSANSCYGCADSNQSTGAQASCGANAGSSASTSANTSTSSAGRGGASNWGRGGLSESLASGECQNCGGDSDFFHIGVLRGK